jgi:hypothetical protein
VITRWWLLLASVGALGICCSSALAHPYIYWVSSGNGLRYDGTVGRANVDGTHIKKKFVTGLSSPYGVAIDRKYIYWANTGTNSIGRANLDGTHANENFISHAHCPLAVAVNKTHVYWVNNNIYCSGHSVGTIGRADLDGKHVNQKFINTVAIVLAVTNSHIYWADYGPNGTFGYYKGRIGRANVDGTHINHRFITGATGTEGLAVGVNSEFIYWDNSAAAGLNYGTLGRAYLTGADPNQQIATTGNTPGGLAVDRTYIYWADGTPGPIGRARLDGTHRDRDFIAVNADAVAVG